MSEVEWSAEGEEAPVKKKRVPSWLWWGCGGGCLLAVIAMIAISLLGVRFFKDATDPEKVWPAVQALLPFDERPEGWTAGGKTVFGVGQYHLRPPGGEPYMILHRMPGPAERDALLDPESPQNKGIGGFGKIQDPEKGTVEIQGRGAPCLRFRPWVPGDENDVSTIRVDLTGEGDQPVLVEIVVEGSEPVSDETVQELLEPFDVWRGK
jgi:hypothetical protein